MAGFGDALSDITPFLQRKYGILQQNANAETQNAATNQVKGYASAGLDNANAAQVAADSLAKRGLMAAQAGNLNVDTKKQTNLLPVSEALGRDPGSYFARSMGVPGPYSSAATAPSIAAGWMTPQRTDLNAGMIGSTPSLLSPAPAAAPAASPLDVAPVGSSLLSRASASQANNIRSSVGLPKYKASDADQSTALGFAKGTSRVPGKGSGKVDTVKAKLAPGEAVLNKGAAEHIGRDLIDHLNEVGAMKMGMTPATKSAKGTGKGMA